MKIAYLGIKGLPSKWGADRVVEAIVQRLSNIHDITVYCSSREVQIGTTFSNIKLFRVPCLAGKYTHMISVNLFASLHAVIWGNFDLIHIHNIETAFVLPILKLRYKVVSTAHGRITVGNKWNSSAAKLMNLMELPFSKLSNKATSVALADANQISKTYNREVIYIPNGIDEQPIIDIQAALDTKKSLDIVQNPFLMCAAGRIIPLKGFHLILEAFKVIPKDYYMIVVGDLNQSPEYSKKLYSLADERVIFVPFISSLPHLLGLIQLSSLFIFPSMNEGMSMMLLEAASTGTPIVCSDILANKTILPKQALHFANGNVDDLKEKLIYAINHPQEMESLGRKAQEHIKSLYSWDKIAFQYNLVYEQVTGLV